jgi:tight adherence protein C
MIAVPAVAAALTFATVIAVARPGRDSNRGPERSNMLYMAGIRSQRDRLAWRALRLSCLLAACAAGSMLAALATLPPATALMVAAATAAVGWWVPRAWVNARVAARRMAMQSDLPVMLDLLQISMRGGMGLPAAWSSVADGVRGSCPALAEEMRHIDLEVSMGTRWGTALANAAERTGVTELRSLGSLMSQSEEFGSELARTLEVMADSLRHDELQTLEERAHQASVKILLPLAALMLPATLLLIVAPLLLLLFQALQRATSS